MNHLCVAVDLASVVNRKDPMVLPPKAIEVEPDLPAWSPSEYEGVAVAPEPAPAADLMINPLQGVIGFVVGILVFALRAYLKHR